MLIPIAEIQLRQDENGDWIAKSELLPGCHAYGESRAESILAFQDAAQAHLQALMDFGKPIPEPFRKNFVLVSV